MKAKRFLSLVLCVMLTISMLLTDVPAGTSQAAALPFPAATAAGSVSSLGGQSSGNLAEQSPGFENPFGDVNPDDWFFDDVGFVFTSGLMNGTGTETPMFSPYMSMSRAMLVTVLYRLAGSPDMSGLPNTFTDVPEDTWYSSAVAWAAANGITNGVGGNRFAPDDIVTREQAAVFVYRYARLTGKVPADEMTEAPDVADKDKISDWALEAVMWCIKNGIITGSPGDDGMLFDPQGNAIRAELAAMLHEFSDNVINNPAYGLPETHTGEKPDIPASTEPPDSDQDSEEDEYFQVSFVTNGGTAISPVNVKSGSKLSNPPIPLKDDYAFTGWYRDSRLTQPFYSDAPIMRNMTLYASYTERDHNYREYVNPVKFLTDCPADISFGILSPESITDNNLGDYITIVNTIKDNEPPDVTVTSLGGNVYSISPRAPYTYTPGDTYELTLVNESLSFLNEKEGVRTIAFSIVKPETFIVEFEDGIVYLLWNQVNVIDDGVYTLTKALADEKGIVAGTTVCLTDELDSDGQGILNENSKIRNVLTVVNTDSPDPPRVMLFTEASGVDDVYENLDLHWNESADMDALMASIDTKKLEQDVMASEGTMRFTKLLAAALNESQTLAGMLSLQDVPGPGLMTLASGSSRIPDPIEHSNKFTITAEALVAGLTVTASLGTAINTNFSDAADDNTWVVLTIAFNYNATIKKIKINASFTFKEFITLEVGGDAGKNRELGLYFDVWVDVFSQTNMEFNVLVKTVDVDEEFLNITDEIQKLIEGFTEDYSDSGVPEVIREALGEKGDYIDLVEVDIFEFTQKIIPSAPVLEIKEEGTFVIRLNLAVGLSAEATLMSARRIGIRGSQAKGIGTYSYEHYDCNKQEFDLYCAGYLGVKAGIRITVSMYFFGLEDLGRIGVQGELGAYMDLYGFLQLHLYKEAGNAPQINMNGGMLMEIGIYIELGLFAESKAFGAKAELKVLDMKFPLFTLGDRYVFYRFKNTGNTVIINKNTYNLKDTGLLDAEMLDLKTGELVDRSYTDLKKDEGFRCEVSNPHFEFDIYEDNLIRIRPQYFGITINGVHVPKGSLRMDGTIRLYYTGDHICFSNTEKGSIYNEIKLIWVDPDVDPNTVNLGTVTATYIINKDGQEVEKVNKTILAGYVPCAVNVEPWLDKQYGGFQCAVVTGIEGNWNVPTWEDATFVVNIKTRRVLVSWMYIRDGKWHYEVYAMKINDMPPYPEGYTTPGQGLIFDHWLRRDYSFIDYSYKVTEESEEGLEYYDAYSRNLTYLEYDTTGQIFTYAGTWEECNEKFEQNQQTMPVVLHNVAQYQNVYVPVYYHYPVKIYTAYGQQFNIHYSSKIVWYPYGTTPPPEIKSYPGCTILGWGEGVSGFGEVEHPYDQLPAVTGETHFYLIVDFKLRQAIFKTDIGTFADGSTTYADSGMIPYPDYLKYMEDFYNANNYYTIRPAYKDEVRYKFSRWDVDYSLDEHGNQIETWNAVWVIDLSAMYTVTFNAGEGAYFSDEVTSITEQHSYGTRMNLSSLTPTKAMDNQYIYTHSGWVDQDGNNYGLNDDIEIKKDMTYTAVYTRTDRIYTITIDAGIGEFPGEESGKKSITLTGKYGEDTGVAESVYGLMPPADDAVYHYEFIGWSFEDETLNELPEVFTQNMYITAIYEQVYNEYTITFDAGSGTFGDGVTTIITQTYHYEDEIDPPANPVKAETEYFEYEFTGWSPPLNSGDTVTWNRTYTATYEAISKEVTLPPSGITVTYGDVTEDICVGSISGYNYEMAESPIDETPVPVLTITGNGLTFSGESNEVYIFIADTVNYVTFNNLSLSGSYDKWDAPLYVLEGENQLTINIDGECVFISTANNWHTLRINGRSVEFVGIDENASLRIHAVGANAVFAYDCDIAFDSLNLSINVEIPEGYEGDYASAIDIDYDGSTQRVCSFVYSDVTINSGESGFYGVGFAVEINNSTFVMDCTGQAGGGPEESDAYIIEFNVVDSNVEITAGQGLWIDGVIVISEDPENPEPTRIRLEAKEDDSAALCATDGITVPEGYDLGGASIECLTDDSTGKSYYTFVIEENGTWIPAKIVKINWLDDED